MKKNTGKTPIEYLNFYRIEKACERLIMTCDTITEIALSSGFNEGGYFSKLFFKEKGMTPSDFRKENINILRT